MEVCPEILSMKGLSIKKKKFITNLGYILNATIENKNKYNIYIFRMDIGYLYQENSNINKYFAI